MCKITVNHILDGGEFIEDTNGIGREYLMLERLLICPVCRKPLRLSMRDSKLYYTCAEHHEYHVVDGVVDFRSREIAGEMWSQSYRNYEDYLNEHLPWNPNYDRGLNMADEMWAEIEAQRPKIILDMACGGGTGIEQHIKRITWPTTIILVDVSHRMLAWNRTYFSTVCHNPYVQMAYLACDGANLPVLTGSLDLVFSNFGFESMQDKMLDGFREAHRVLKPGGCAIYNKSVIAGREDGNTKKWTGLLYGVLNEQEKSWMDNQLLDLPQWLDICRHTGFTENKTIKIYGELPAPEDGPFPFENEIMQWMAEYVLASQK